LAGVAAGLWPSLDQAVRLLKVETRSLPVQDHVAVYQRLFPVYQGLYPALKDSVHALWMK
jgi:sugar (pentulose or hexulose) kinase